MAIFYHGSKQIFDRFDISHIYQGDGKAKFGHGHYLTERFETAAHYAAGNDKVVRPECRYYVYTVEIPDIEEGHNLKSASPVDPGIVTRVEKALGERIPSSAKVKGKFFRKYIGNILTGNRSTEKVMTGSLSKEGEKAVADFLVGTGIPYLIWPVAQSKPDGLLNCTVLDESLIRIIRIEEVELDSKIQLIPGSQKLVREF